MASPRPEDEFERFVVRFLPEVAATAREAVAWMRARYPAANVLVYDNYNALAVGFGPGERPSDMIFSIAVYPRWVSLFFFQGALDLDDPAGLLEGSGSQSRHIKLKSAADLGREEIGALMDQSLLLTKKPMPTEGEGRVIIKSISEKQRPRRP
jgi:hypothetical protein